MINVNFDFEKLEKRKMKPLNEIIDFNNKGKDFVDPFQVAKLIGTDKIAVKQATKKGYIEAPEHCVADLTYPKSETRRGRVQGNGKITGTLTATTNLSVINFPNVRKIAPMECWKLMGFSEESFNKAAEVTSDAQLCIQAGNSIVVNVVEAILKELHRDTTDQINYYELCAGIGAVSEAYNNLGYNANLVGYSEIDKHAPITFEAMYGASKNYGDMTKINIIDELVDVLSGGTPCQDYSVAGTGAGGEKGSGTRSSLLHEQSRIAIVNKIPVVIWENVKNAESGKHKNSVEEYCKDLENAGYTNHKKILTAVDFGIPQGRERVFIVSINEEFIKRRINERN